MLIGLVILNSSVIKKSLESMLSQGCWQLLCYDIKEYIDFNRNVLPIIYLIQIKMSGLTLSEKQVILAF